MKTLKPTTAGSLHLDQPELRRSDRAGSSESRLTYRWVILRRPGTSRKQTTKRRTKPIEELLFLLSADDFG